MGFDGWAVSPSKLMGWEAVLYTVKSSAPWDKTKKLSKTNSMGNFLRPLVTEKLARWRQGSKGAQMLDPPYVGNRGDQGQYDIRFIVVSRYKSCFSFSFLKGLSGGETPWNEKSRLSRFRAVLV